MIFDFELHAKGNLSLGILVDYSHDGKEVNLQFNLGFCHVLVGYGWGT